MTEPGDPGGGPIRTCVGCGRRAPQHELVRFVAGADGTPAEGRTLPGRGAWLCAGTLEVCRGLAERRGAFDRAFRSTRPGRRHSRQEAGS